MPEKSEILFSSTWWSQYFVHSADWVFTSGWRILLIVILFFIALRGSRAIVHRLVHMAVRPRGKDALYDLMASKRQATLASLFDAVITITLIILALLMIFQEIGFSVGPILASAGVVGVAVGFGAQSLVKDALSGTFIILEQQFSVGDVIKTSGLSGTVEEINLRTTILRDSDGSVHIIPNGQINQVTVFTRDWSRLVLDLDISYSADIDAASDIVKRELDAYAAANPDCVLEPPEVLGVQNLGESSIQIRAWMKVLPGKQWPAARQLRAQIKKAFDTAGIEIPFPQRAPWTRQEMATPSSPKS